MRKLILLSAILMFASILHAQVPFRVITVNGEIVATKANITLENGIEIFSDDNFDFRKPNSRAAMINAERGRVLLTEQNASDAFSKAAFAPAISSISARSGSVSSMAELKSIFDGKILIIENIELKIGPSEFPMESDKFFFIRYNHNGETINKKLSFNGDTLIINKMDLFTIDGEPIENPDINQLNLYYYRKGTDQPESILINTFEPVFVESNLLKPEIDIIFDEFKGKPIEDIISEVYDYLNSFYGKIDRGNLESWIKREYKVKI